MAANSLAVAYNIRNNRHLNPADQYLQPRRYILAVKSIDISDSNLHIVISPEESNVGALTTINDLIQFYDVYGFDLDEDKEFEYIDVKSGEFNISADTVNDAIDEIKMMIESNHGSYVILTDDIMADMMSIYTSDKYLANLKRFPNYCSFCGSQLPEGYAGPVADADGDIKFYYPKVDHFPGCPLFFKGDIFNYIRHSISETI